MTRLTILKLCCIVILTIVINIPCASADETISSIISGRVMEKGTRRPLGGVNIFILPGERIEITDKNGKFSFDNIASGDYKLAAILLNYKKYGPERIRVKEGEGLDISIYLEKEFVTMMEIVVETKRLKREEISPRELRVEEAKKIAGAGGDILKAIQSLPGAAGGNEWSSELYVRGGGPLDNIFQMDKMFIGNPYHIGGLISTINSDLIKSFDFFAGGFGARYGDIMGGMGGVIDITTRDGRSDRLGGKFDIGFSLSSLQIEGPSGDNSSFFMSGRKSYIELFPIGGEGEDIIPSFYDYQGKWSYDLSEHNRLNLLLYGADDRIVFSTTKRNRKDPVLSSVSSSFDTSFHTQGFSIKSLITPRLVSELTISHAIQTEHFDITQDLFLDARFKEVRIWEELSYRYGRHYLLTGIRGGYGWWEINGRFTRPPKEGQPEYNFTESEKIISNIDEDSFAVGYYLDDSISVTQSLKFILGGRLDRFQPIKETLFSPRTSMFYNIGKRMRLKAAWGYYRQAPQGDEFSEKWGNPDIDSNLSIHYILGIDHDITDAVNLDLQTYYKDMKDLVVRSTDPEEVYCNCGVGYAYGTELLLRHKLTDRFFGWVSYSYSVSKRKDIPGFMWRNFTFDRPHIATIVANYQFTKKWNIGTKWQYAAGSHYTPVAERIYDADADRFIPIYGDVNSRRLPPSHRLDLRTEYKNIYNRWIFTTYLEIWNLYMHRNPVGISYNDDYSESSVERFIPIIIFGGITAEF